MADFLTQHFLQDEFLSYIQGTPKVYPRSTQGTPILLNDNQRHYFPCPKLQKKSLKVQILYKLCKYDDYNWWIPEILMYKWNTQRFDYNKCLILKKVQIKQTFVWWLHAISKKCNFSEKLKCLGNGALQATFVECFEGLYPLVNFWFQTFLLS